EGGQVELMDRLISEIESADDLTTVAFVKQKAASAGALISLSCGRLYMMPGSNIGSALPILLGPFGNLVPIHGLGDDRSPEMEKMLSHLRAHFRAKAQVNKRSEALAEAMVDPNLGVMEVAVNGVPRFVTLHELDNVVAQYGAENVQKVREVCRKGEIVN